MTLSLSLTALVGCSSGEEEPPGEDSSSSAGAPEGEGWTVLHYSMADTDLEPFMVEDVNELGSVGATDDLHLRELMDRSAEYGDDEVLDQGTWIGARVFDIAEPGTTELVEDLGDVDTADPATLATFIADGIAAHPAAHYALIISDHGASWPGIGPDEGSEFSVLDLAEITTGIADGLEQAGVDKLDLLGFDACLMASYEVASAVAPYAERLVASEELEPGHGWDYTSLQVLADDPATDVDTLGAAIVDGFAAQAEASGTSDTITLSMLDLTQMPAVDEALAAFSGALSERAATVAPVVGRVEAETLGFARSPDETQDSHMVDLGILASSIGVEALDVSDQADTLVRAINDAVVTSVDGTATRGATGLSIYFPPAEDLVKPEYLEVTSAETWAGFLASYYDAGDAIPEAELPQFTNPAGEAELEYDGDGFSITGTYDAVSTDNLSSSTMQYAILGEDGSLTYIGEESGFLVEDEPVAVGFYDLTSLVISDGEDSAPAYVSLDYSEEGGSSYLNVPLTYYAAADVDRVDPQDVLLALVLDEEIVSETYYVLDPETGAYGELVPDPDGLIVPNVPTLAPDGTETWGPTTDIGLYADTTNLTYEFTPLDPGTVIQIDLSVTDYGDNSSTVSGQVEVP
ncbi:MAG: peptidase clostripain [Nocardioides sp.]|nr:peptidase clostripain [Nocardioides sp.]